MNLITIIDLSKYFKAFKQHLTAYEITVVTAFYSSFLCIQIYFEKYRLVSRTKNIIISMRIISKRKTKLLLILLKNINLLTYKLHSRNLYYLSCLCLSANINYSVQQDAVCHKISLLTPAAKIKLTFTECINFPAVNGRLQSSFQIFVF